MHKPGPAQAKLSVAQKQPVKMDETLIAMALSRPKAISTNPTLRSVHGALTFRLRDGKELTNLVELARALEEMADETFFHHANGERNDFSSWVKDVFELDGLSDSIRTTSKTETGTKIYRHLLQEMMK